jgi:acyl carrier protein
LTEQHATIEDPGSAADTVRELVIELAPNPDGAAGKSDPHLVDDLEYHSLALMELAFTLEDEFELDPLDEETALSIVTLGDVERHVVSALEARSNSS